MKDEQRAPDHRLGRKEVISPGKNDTKPYAGEGGIKKMLAKRKLELEEEENRPKEVVEEKEEGKGTSIEDELWTSAPVRKAPQPLKDDWYSLASGPSGSNEISSLRVGRAKRNHIARPTARSRTKFSAAFEDDGDDVMADQEKEMLEEAARKAPVFNIPAGFNFPKDVG
jgi:nucleoporin NUP1